MDSAPAVSQEAEGLGGPGFRSQRQCVQVQSPGVRVQEGWVLQLRVGVGGPKGDGFSVVGAQRLEMFQRQRIHKSQCCPYGTGPTPQGFEGRGSCSALCVVCSQNGDVILPESLRSISSPTLINMEKAQPAPRPKNQADVSPGTRRIVRPSLCSAPPRAGRVSGSGVCSAFVQISPNVTLPPAAYK